MTVEYDNYEYIADKVLKDVMVTHESDQYYIHNNDLRLEETLRANGTPSEMITWDVSTGSYVLNEHALKDVITDRDRDNIDTPPLQLEAQTAFNLKSKIQIRMEYETHKLLFTTTTFSNNDTKTSASSWKYHTTTSSPLQNVLSATSYITKYAGSKPNTGVTSLDVLDALKENVNVHERIKYTQKSVYGADLIASMMDLQNIYVGTARYNTVDEGIADDFGMIWGNDFLVAYFDPAPTLKTRTAAVNFRLKKRGIPWTVKKWREEDIDGDYIQVQTFFKPAAIATTGGYLIKACAL